MLYGRVFVPELHELIERRDFRSVREILVELHPADAADALSNLDTDSRAVTFRVLPASLAAQIFEHLSRDVQEELLHSLAQSHVAALLGEMSPDDRTALLEELPGRVTRRLIEMLSPEERRIATTLLGYPEESVGRRMTPDFISIDAGWTVNEVIEHLRRIGSGGETMNILYVVDSGGTLIDDVRLREIVVAPSERLVRDLMDERFVALHATDDQEEALRVFERYDRVALPVVNKDGVLLGVVTADDFLDVAREEATEDMHRAGGLEAVDEPYLDASFTVMLRKRAVWLSVLFLGELLTTTAMRHYEVELARAVVLAFFIPLIISSGGNSGSQASTLVIRALALGEIGLRDWWRIAGREIRVGLCLGLILGVLGLLRVVIGAHFSAELEAHSVLLGLTVGVALVGVVLWGTIAGSMLPLLLRGVGIDPAVSSGPFVATLVDVCGLVIYFAVALWLLRGSLL